VALTVAARSTVALQERFSLRSSDFPFTNTSHRFSDGPHSGSVPLGFPPLTSTCTQSSHRFEAKSSSQGVSTLQLYFEGSFWNLTCLVLSQWPTERQRHRKLLALGVAVGLIVIVFLFLGAWIGWMLSATSRLRQPWIWAARFLYLGSSDGVVRRSPAEAGWARRWKRMGLLAYWAGTIVIAVGGWQTHLVRARRIRVGSRANIAAEKKEKKERERERASQVKRDAKKEKENGSTPTAISTGISGATAGGMKLLGIGGGRRGSGENDQQAGGGPSSGGASEPAPTGRIGAESARETKAVHASLNMRRKFFHALAVLMFVPGIAIDVSSILFPSRPSLIRVAPCSLHSLLSPSASLSHSSLSPNTLASLHFIPLAVLFTSSSPNSSTQKTVVLLS